MMILGPLLLVVSGSMIVLVATTLKGLIAPYALPGVLVGLVFLFINALSYAFVWVLLVMLYLFMPNARVGVGPASLGGAVAAALYLLVQWIYIRFQIGIASYGAVYGSFAALPLLLIWIRTSWMIVLFGGEVARAWEHRETYGFLPDYRKMGIALKERLLLRVFHVMVLRFEQGEEPPSSVQISRILALPLGLVEELLGDLIDAGLASAVERNGSSSALFQPAQSVEETTLKRVLDRYERKAEAGEGQDRTGKIAAHLEEMALAAEKSPGNVKVKEL